MRPFLRLVAVLWCLLPASAWSAAEDDIDHILRLDDPPTGVVFEIVSSDRELLSWAIPQVRLDAERLRARFPGLPVAVVSHGREEFALMSKNAEGKFSKLHLDVKKLTQQENIPVHVCGTHASWKGVTPEEFPDYVDVAPAGPVQINNYHELGYVVVRLKRSSD